ncbi:hypothetical protein J158_04396 [Xanthomonas citri subsp. citri UI6]|nr:hypothetical protein J158_04396 [Xanthomonas citri subsp. citri UI6]
MGSEPSWLNVIPGRAWIWIGWIDLNKIFYARGSYPTHCVQVDGRISLAHPVDQSVPSRDLSLSLVFSGALDQVFNWQGVVIDWIIVFCNCCHCSIKLPVRGGHTRLIECMLRLMTKNKRQVISIELVKSALGLPDRAWRNAHGLGSRVESPSCHSAAQRCKILKQHRAFRVSAVNGGRDSAIYFFGQRRRAIDRRLQIGNHVLRYMLALLVCIHVRTICETYTHLLQPERTTQVRRRRRSWLKSR